jgi:hypothetical protein
VPGADVNVLVLTADQLVRRASWLRDGDRKYNDTDTKEYKDVILERFDPDAIARATTKTKARWDWRPFFDATKQYVR